MHYTYRTKGVCASKIDIDLEDGTIQKVEFTGGCDGNHSGIASLLVGMPAEEAVRRLSGITCGFRPTSCPDQLARAIREASGPA